MIVEAPDKYRLQNVSVIATRGGETEAYDITAMAAEINIYESIDLPYLSGTVVVSDSSSFSSLINFNGTEIVRVSLWVNDESIVTKDFHVHKITAHEKSKVNSAVSLYTLNLIEKQGYLSNFYKLRKAFSGNISTIISAIYETYLKSEIRVEESKQTIKYLAPNLSPLGVCEVLKNRATSNFGEPMFLYSSIKEGPVFESLGTISQKEPILDKPFIYSAIGTESFERKARTISQVLIPENDNIIKLQREGAIRSTYFDIDPMKRSINKIEFDAVERAEFLGDRKLHDYNLFTTELTIDGEEFSISDFDSLYQSGINTTDIFDDYPSLNEEKVFEEHLDKVSSRSDRLLLEKQQMDIIIPGFYLLSKDSNTSVGNIIEVQIPKDMPANANTADHVDKKRSGKWIISRVRHKFDMNEKYVAVCNLRRASGQDPIDGTEEIPV